MNDIPPLPKVLAVDFDGTLCRSDWPGLGPPIDPVIDYVRKKKEHGYSIILWTCRTGVYLEQAVEWCKEHDVPIDYVNENHPDVLAYYGESRKIYADKYIDDKAVEAEEIVWKSIKHTKKK